MSQALLHTHLYDRLKIEILDYDLHDLTVMKSLCLLITDDSIRLDRSFDGSLRTSSSEFVNKSRFFTFSSSLFHDL